MSDRTYGPEEKSKLERIINEGVVVHTEIDTLKEGLSETVKAIAEELEIKPSLINKAIRIAKNRDWDRHYDEFEDLETILTTVGKDS